MNLSTARPSIPNHTIAEQITWAAGIEAEKSIYKQPRGTVRAHVANHLTCLHEALAQKDAPLGIVELGRRLTLARLGGRGLTAIFTQQVGKLPDDRIFARVDTDGPLQFKGLPPEVMPTEIVLPLYSTYNLSVNEEEAWGEVQARNHTRHTAIFVGKPAVDICLRPFAM